MSIDKFATIRVKENGDWDLNTILTQNNAIAQNLLIALREHKNDFFMALDAGLDSTTLNDKTDREIAQDIQNIILEQKGITSVVIVKTERVNRTLEIVFIYNTILNESKTIIATVAL